ncbi:Cyclin-Dependent Kinase 11A [Manis pentadactyla]|nr:Cyclin-Dependent Kinase 11A [Manis pentadactyla]
MSPFAKILPFPHPLHPASQSAACEPLQTHLSGPRRDKTGWRCRVDGNKLQSQKRRGPRAPSADLGRQRRGGGRDGHLREEA